WWAFGSVNEEEFKQAETKKMSLINSKKIGPEFAIKRHLEAIYTSRPLSDLISKCSSAYSSSNISFGGKQGLENNTVTKSSTIQNFSTPLDSNYISAELGLDIDTESSTSQDLNSVTQNFSTALDSNYISAELGLDIDTE
ncbi:12032_t:CDS:2, partial [Rhizophagus irregularis]